MTNREEQENELSLLKAMYQSNELTIGKPTKNIDSDGDECNGQANHSNSIGRLNSRDDDEIAFCLKKCSDLINTNLDVQFPVNYPKVDYPYVNVRSGKINEVKITADLRAWIKNELELGMPMVLEIVNWLTENYGSYILEDNNRVATPTRHEYARYWIYTHHIYSRNKQKDLKMQAKRLDLHGFVMPGKPGAIVVEGILEDCHEFWRIIRGWSWQDIVLKRKEVFHNKSGLKLPKFFELVSQSDTLDHKHADCSFLKSTLKEYGLEENFSYLIEIN